MLDGKQQQAIDDCCDMSKRLVTVTGQAGTGKTTIIKEVYNRLREKGIHVAVAAPTGKAARRIKEATGIEAVTLHRLLEYPHPGEYDEETGKPLATTEPKRSRPTADNHDAQPLEQDVIIVDEYAMVSTELHRNLVGALKNGALLRVFGDIAQLPPIDDTHIAVKDYKTPFQKCLEMRHSHTLDKVYRQDEQSDVLHAARSIRNGRMPAKTPRFRLTMTDRPLPVLTRIVKEALDEGINYRLLENQIITPSKKSWIGTHALNSMLQTILNPDSEKYIIPPRHKWDNKHRVELHVGDKVVCTENCYDLRPYMDRYAEVKRNGMPNYGSYIDPPDTKLMLNGETGMLLAIRDDGSLEIDFGDRIVEVPSEMPEFWPAKHKMILVDKRMCIDLAYALTTHKCQGSEFNNVIYVINKSVSFMLNRKNFYTAVTRARLSAHVITDQRAFSRALGIVG